jgi:hypothetical protein
MDLDKFWLGNVNEKGDVDQEGYDEETLEIVNTKVSSLKQKLVDGVVDEKDTQPQDTDEDDVPVEKEATAVDYSHEKEAVEDDTALEEREERERNYRRAELAFQNSTRGQISETTSKRVVHDDYDEEESGGEEKAAPVADPQVPPAENTLPTDAGAEIAPETSVSAEATKPAPVAAVSSQPEQVPKTDSIRKHGLLLFSEMFLFPSIQPRIARTRYSHCPLQDSCFGMFYV